MQHETHALVRQLARTLARIPTWIDRAEAHAAARRFDANLLLQCRLAPDMFPLVRQIGAACDNVKLLAARTTGRTAPKHADDQATWDEVRARIADVLAWLDTLSEDDFAPAASTVARFGWIPGQHLDAEPYVYAYALPNFHFHAAMAYAILRHNGVDVGKADFLGPLPFVADTASA